MAAAAKVAPKDQLPSLTALNSLIAELKATEHAVLRGAAGAAAAAVGGAAAVAAAPRKKVGHDSPSLGVDFAWYPTVPLGHTAYSWGADDTDADVKLSNVFAKHEHHYVGKHSHDADAKDAKDAAAAPAPAPAAAAPAKPAAPAAAAADKPKDDKKADGKGKGQGQKGDDKKKGDDKNAKKADAKPKAEDKKKADDKKKGAAKPEMPKATAAAGSVGVFARLDIRAGKIVKAWKHPKADKLYVEEIDVGEPKPRTIVSGLVEHVPLDQFQGATVCVICNLKPADMRGQMSYGMVLAASNDNRKTVELVSPAEGSKPGDRVSLKGEPSTADAKAVDAEVDLFAPGNAWIDAKDFLKTDANCHAQYNGKPMVTPAGPARSKTKANANIS